MLPLPNPNQKETKTVTKKLSINHQIYHNHTEAAQSRAQALEKKKQAWVQTVPLTSYKLCDLEQI